MWKPSSVWSQRAPPDDTVQPQSFTYLHRAPPGTFRAVPPAARQGVDTMAVPEATDAQVALPTGAHFAESPGLPGLPPLPELSPPAGSAPAPSHAVSERRRPTAPVASAAAGA